MESPEIGEGNRRGRMRDARLVERALAERWPIPKGRRRALMGRMIDIAMSEGASAREAVSAMKAILAARKLTLDAVTVAIRADEHDELVERLKALEDALERRDER